MELYEFAHQLFIERLNAHEGHSAELQAFRRRNAVASRFYDFKATVRVTLLHNLRDAAAIIAMTEFTGLEL
jgi:hypothetical protein